MPRVQIWQKGHIKHNEKVENDHVECKKCGSEDVKIEIEEVEFDRRYLKANFRCTEDHYRDGRDIESFGYYNTKYGKRKALLRIGEE